MIGLAMDLTDVDVHELPMPVPAVDEVSADPRQEPESVSNGSKMSAREMAVTTVGSLAVGAAVLQWVLPICVIC